MPFRLIGSIILLVIVTIFCGFNLGDSYKSDLNLLVHTFHAVPVFLIVLGSFFAGCIVVLPFTFGKRRSSKKAKPVNAAKASDSAGEKAAAAAAGATPAPDSAERATSASPAPKKLSPFEAARESSRARREKTLAEKAEKKARKEAEKAAKAKAKAKAAAKSTSSDSSVTHSENDVPVIK